MKRKQYYSGQGEQHSDGWKTLPEVNPEALRSAEGYLATSELAAAVDVALTLGMPLLLTGEPGCGKSRLAHSIAWELDLGKPLEFVVKSDTQGRDLFYHFDTVGRFHASHGGNKDAHPRNFISFKALGRAILYAKPPSYTTTQLGLPEGRVHHPGEPRRSVVLIDEIDKAPRDVPNDILDELESMRFRIPELEAEPGHELVIGLDEAESGLRPIVIITSNSEKALPDAFLRRCIYFHLPFPGFEAELRKDGKDDTGIPPDAITVERIVAQRLGHRYVDSSSKFIDDAVTLFRFLRNPRRNLEKPPSLAELLNWLDYLLPAELQGEEGVSLTDAGNEALVHSVKVCLFKKVSDQGRAQELVGQWQKDRSPGN